MGDIAQSSLQNILVKLATEECHDTVKGLRNYLRAIFREAREQENIPIDPTRKLVLPQTRKPHRPFLTVEQIRLIEPRLEPRDQTILRLLTRCGLRPGELFRLAPEDVGADRTVHVNVHFPAAGWVSRDRRKRCKGRLTGLVIRGIGRDLSTCGDQWFALAVSLQPKARRKAESHPIGELVEAGSEAGLRGSWYRGRLADVPARVRHHRRQSRRRLPQVHSETVASREHHDDGEHLRATGGRERPASRGKGRSLIA
jgi:hypothetical protein